jgi:hypothetical protein
LVYKLKTLTKIKTYIKAIILLTISAFTFTGCTKDEATTPPDYIKGKWKGVTRFWYEDSGYQNVQEYWYFGTDGTLIFDATAWNSVDGWQTQDQRVGTYIFNENSITITWTKEFVRNGVTVIDWYQYSDPPPPITFQIVEIDNRTMELTWGVDSYNFSRVFE